MKGRVCIPSIAHVSLIISKRNVTCLLGRCLICGLLFAIFVFSLPFRYILCSRGNKYILNYNKGRARFRAVGYFLATHGVYIKLMAIWCFGYFDFFYSFILGIFHGNKMVFDSY